MQEPCWYTLEYCTVLLQDLSMKGRRNPILVTLKFITGLRSVPPLGWDNKVTFFYTYHKTMPEVATCFLQLWLPLGCPSYRAFEDNFDRAVLYSLNHFGILWIIHLYCVCKYNLCLCIIYYLQCSHSEQICSLVLNWCCQSGRKAHYVSMFL